jgi:hypothetical protein
LDFGSALHSIGNTLELDEHSIARRFDDMPLVLGDDRIDELEPVGPEPRESARLVGFHQSAITDHVSRENRRQSPLATTWFHCALPH